MISLAVVQARFEEARDITDALRDRLRNLRRELQDAQAKEGDVLFVMRKVRTSTMELVEAEDYEARCWAGYSEARRKATRTPTESPRKRQNAA